MEATDPEHRNTVSTTARRLLHLKKNGADPDSPICNYYPDSSSTKRCITSYQVVKLLCLHIDKFFFQRLGL